MPTRIALRVEVNLDPVPGTFHEPEDFAVHLNRLLNDMFPWYQPTVVYDDRPEQEPEQPERWIVTDGTHALGVYFSTPDAANRWIEDNNKTGFYIEKLPKPDHQAVRDALAKLDGTVEASVSLITGLSVAEINDLGGVPERCKKCGLELRYCPHGTDAVCTDPTCIDVGDDLVGHVHR